MGPVGSGAVRVSRVVDEPHRGSALGDRPVRGLGLQVLLVDVSVPFGGGIERLARDIVLRLLAREPVGYASLIH